MAAGFGAISSGEVFQVDVDCHFTMMKGEINAILFGVDGFVVVLVFVASMFWVGWWNIERFGLSR